MIATLRDSGAGSRIDGNRVPGPFKAALGDGRHVRIRPIIPADRDHLVRGLSRASDETLYFRFHSPIQGLSDADLRYLTQIDYANHMAWGAFALDEPGEPGVAVARYIADADDPTQAETGIIVLDEYQDAGLGTLLMETLAISALNNGIEVLTGRILPENVAGQRLFARLGGRTTARDRGLIISEIRTQSSWRSSSAALSVVQKR
jgi:RimJ/RimL family protein N-acetyltransferase